MRPFRAEDGEAAFTWFGATEVMKLVPGGADVSLDATRARLASYQEHQEKHGFSKWMIVERASGRPVGDAGLLLLDYSTEVDLGFRIARPYWGQGYATEVATAWIAAAFNQLSLSRLSAFAHPDNAASLRVLRKVGMRSTGRVWAKGIHAETFMLDAGDRVVR